MMYGDEFKVTVARGGSERDISIKGHSTYDRAFARLVDRGWVVYTGWRANPNNQIGTAKSISEVRRVVKNFLLINS